VGNFSSKFDHLVLHFLQIFHCFAFVKPNVIPHPSSKEFYACLICTALYRRSAFEVDACWFDVNVLKIESKNRFTYVCVPHLVFLPPPPMLPG
jgi:hypothetical protein